MEIIYHIAKTGVGVTEWKSVSYIKARCRSYRVEIIYLGAKTGAAVCYMPLIETAYALPYSTVEYHVLLHAIYPERLMGGWWGEPVEPGGQPCRGMQVRVLSDVC